MSTTTQDPLIESYMGRLRTEARSLPRSRREELLEQIEEHLREALPPGHTEADARNALEQLGDPEAIVAEEFDRLGIRRAKPGKLEWAVVFLLPFGGLVFFVGWIAGVILLWASRVWTTREKLIGTLLPPGGLAAVLFFAVFAGGTTCTVSVTVGPGVVAPARTYHHVVQQCPGSGIPTALGVALLIVFVIAGIATPIFLARRALRARY